jgi:Rrf2 family transcriptional regulator, cysteine metabolism repressor
MKVDPSERFCLTVRLKYTTMLSEIVEKEGTMQISQKCQYALRALFYLAVRSGEGPIRIADIAENQAIPVRFLEAILAQLKQGKFVASQRGNVGGYYLVRSPGELTVGEVIRFIEGPLGPVACLDGSERDEERCALYGECVFMPMWEKAEHAISDVYDGTTFQSLVEQEKKKSKKAESTYSI